MALKLQNYPRITLENILRTLLAAFSLVAAFAAPVALHAVPITGQYSAGGSVVDDGTKLTFQIGTIFTGRGTQLGTFALLVPDNTAITAGSQSINYSPYVANSEIFTVGSLTTDLVSLEYTQFDDGHRGFSGNALFTAPGYDPTAGTFYFSTQGNGVVTFSATGFASAPSPVPEPSTLALLGTGAFGFAGAVRRKLIR